MLGFGGAIGGSEPDASGADARNSMSLLSSGKAPGMLMPVRTATWAGGEDVSAVTGVAAGANASGGELITASTNTLTSSYLDHDQKPS
jgi:hypothetical protein